MPQRSGRRTTCTPVHPQPRPSELQERLYCYFLTPEVQDKYDEVIQDWLNKDYVQIVHPGEGERFYLPHFPVIRESKATTKVRVVLNGRFAYQGASLKSTILLGPKVLNDLVEVQAQQQPPLREHGGRQGDVPASVDAY